MSTVQQDSFKNFVLDQLRGLDGVQCRAMFGGHGLYCGESIFGIIFQGRLYLKTTATTRPRFEQRGMKPFQPNVRQRLKSYFEVPAEVVENAVEFRAWSREALGILP